jgi:site-specific DNA recombinase
MRGDLAIIYARVSTERQEDNTSLDAQIAACQRFAEQQGWAVVDVFRETFSGEFIYARPEFQRALRIVETGNIQHVIVDVPDRLGSVDISIVTR